MFSATSQNLGFQTKILSLNLSGLIVKMFATDYEKQENPTLRFNLDFYC